MGAGKTKIGRRLAARLSLPFFDSDNEIETAAGETIAEIFRNRGEAVFRDGERRVIARLLAQPTCAGYRCGGAFMDPSTRGNSPPRCLGLAALISHPGRTGRAPRQLAVAAGADPRAVLADLIERRH